jgi:CheY-like chemotaxis protein
MVLENVGPRTEHRLKILIAEDDEVDREMARHALDASEIGAECISASTGAEAIKRLTAEQFDCAIIDHQLSDIDGLEVLRAARKAECQTPIIMLTGQADAQLAVEIMKAGANDSLSKSRLSRDLLSQAVRHAMRLHDAESQAQTATARGAESEQRYQQLALEMKRLQEIADSANAARNRLLSIVSRELRAPLTSVSSSLQSLESEARLSDDAKSLLEMIRRNVELQARVIDALLSQEGEPAQQSDGKDGASNADFVLPAAPKTTIRSPKSQPTTEKNKSLRILLVDDHEDAARAMGRLLGALGHQVTLANTVGGALNAFAGQKFDLIVSDIGLPDGSGLDLMRQIRQKYDVRGIALSGFGLDEDLQKSREAGFSRHLTKPVTFERLESAIRELIDGDPSQRQ